jgi:hypothetical protein
MHHFVKEITAKEEKDIIAQGIPPMQVKATKKGAAVETVVDVNEHLLEKLVTKLTKTETPKPQVNTRAFFIILLCRCFFCYHFVVFPAFFCVGRMSVRHFVSSMCSR